MLRPFDDKMKFREDSSIGTESDYGPELVVVIPFSGEMRVKSICVIGDGDGQAPSKMKLYKNEEAVDINLIEEKKPIQTIDLAENLTGELEYPLNVSKFNNVSNVVIGFDENFGGSKTGIKFIGLKGEKLRDKTKTMNIVYEVRANLADHKTKDDPWRNSSNLGM